MPSPPLVDNSKQEILFCDQCNATASFALMDSGKYLQSVSCRSLLHMDPSARPQTAECLRHSYLAGLEAPSSWPHSSMHSNNSTKQTVSGESVGSCLGSKVYCRFFFPQTSKS